MNPDPHKSLREHVLYLLRGGGATCTSTRRWRTFRPFSVAARSRPCPTVLGGCWNTAHRPMGHPGVQPQPEARLAALAGRLLADRRRPAR